jgi:hypothetical protein
VHSHAVVNLVLELTRYDSNDVVLKKRKPVAWARCLKSETFTVAQAVPRHFLLATPVNKLQHSS